MGCLCATLNGIDCHIGSQILDIEPFSEAACHLAALVDRLRAAGIELKHIDMGGGLGVQYESEAVPPIADYIEALTRPLGVHNLTLILEPGRSIVANAGGPSSARRREIISQLFGTSESR